MSSSSSDHTTSRQLRVVRELGSSCTCNRVEFLLQLCVHSMTTAEQSRVEPLLVIIFGASGSGKTSLLHEISSRFPSTSVHRKATDRPLKRYDTEEIYSVAEVLSTEYEYIYNQYGHRYGIQGVR